MGSTFKLEQISEDGMWRYEAYINAISTPRGSINTFHPDAKRYATQKRLDSIQKNSKEFPKHKLIFQDTKDTLHVDITQYEAQLYCSNLKLNEKEDWSLPTIDELRSIFKNKSFKVESGTALWSGTTTKENNSYAYAMSTRKYKSFFADKTRLLQARCIRYNSEIKKR